MSSEFDNQSSFALNALNVQGNALNDVNITTATTTASSSSLDRVDSMILSEVMITHSIPDIPPTNNNDNISTNNSDNVANNGSNTTPSLSPNVTPNIVPNNAITNAMDVNLTPESVDMTNLAMPNTFEQIPLSSVINRIDAGNECLNELLVSFKSRLELEEKTMQIYTKISRQNIFEHEITQSSTEKGLGFLKNYYIYLSQENVKYHKGMMDDVIKHLETVKQHRSSEINKFKLLVQQCFREVNMAVDALDKAKKNYIKAKNDVMSTQQKLTALDQAVIEFAKLQEEKRREKEQHPNSKPSLMGRILSSAFEVTPEIERDKQRKKLVKRYKILLECTEMIVNRKRMLVKKIEERDSAIGMAALAFEAAELDRMAQTSIALKAFCELERTSLEKKTKLLTKLESVVDVMDSKADLKMYIKKEKNNDYTHKHSRALSLLDWDFNRKMKSTKEGEFATTTEYASLASGSYGLYPERPSSASIRSLGDLSRVSWGEVRTMSIDALDLTSIAMYLNTAVGLDDDDLAPAPTSAGDIPLLSSETQAGAASTTSSLSGQSVAMGTVLAVEKPQSKGSALFTPFKRRSTAATPATATAVAVAVNISSPGSPEQSDRKLASIGTQMSHPVTTTIDKDESGEYEVLGSDAVAMQSPNSSSNRQLTGDDVDVDANTQSISDAAAETERMEIQVQLTRLRRKVTTLFGIETLEDESQQSVSENANAVENDSKDATSIDDWDAMFEYRECRDYFMQELDEKRGTHSLLTTESSFYSLRDAMKSLLNVCSKIQDIKTAMRIGNMANTFHRIPPLNELATVTEGNRHSDRWYLQQDPELRNHSIWREEGFWDSALFIGIAAELDHRDAILWDDLTPDQLREEIVGIHNIVFGQLGTMAVTMHEVGLSHVEVAKRLTKMSRIAQLNEDQIFDLLKTVRSTFRHSSSTTTSSNPVTGDNGTSVVTGSGQSNASQTIAASRSEPVPPPMSPLSKPTRRTSNSIANPSESPVGSTTNSTKPGQQSSRSSISGKQATTTISSTKKPIIHDSDEYAML